MFKEALFIVFHGFDPNNGISKKISYQVNAIKTCGINTHLCYMEEGDYKRRYVDNQIIADYGNGVMSKILKRIELLSIAEYAIKNKIEFVYIRSNHNASFFTIRMVKKMKKAGIKVVMEIPTFPYDSEYHTQGMNKQIFQDKIFRKKLAKELDAIVTFSDYEHIFGQKTIRISNGIDFNSIKIKSTYRKTDSILELIGVAEIHPWHGFDRVIKGLAVFYSRPQSLIVRFHIIGYFFFDKDEKLFREMIADYHLESYVIFYGKKHGEELDAIFEKCDFGIGSLGRHRVNINRIKTLKNREYAARGIPFIYSETDSDFDNKPYVMKAPADESPIDIQQVVDFYKHFNMSPTEIRNSIQDLSWTSQMKHVVEEVYKEGI